MDYAAAEHDLSMTRACGLMKSSYYYQGSPREDGALRDALRNAAAIHRRWGYRFLMTVLRRAGSSEKAETYREVAR